jgi:hypothetical protein
MRKTIALRFVNVSFFNKPSLYALKTLNLKLTLPSLAWRQVFLCGVFVWGGKAILLVQNLVKYTVNNSCRCSPHNPIPSPPPPPLHIVSIYTSLLIQTGKGGEGWTSEKVRGALVHKRGQKYQHDWLCLQSNNSKTPVKTTFGFDVFVDGFAYLLLP